MKELIIDSKKHGRKVFLIDDDQYEKVMKFKWNVQYHNNHFYAQSTIKLHKFIMGTDSSVGEVVDHISHNTLDNRKENLRITTHQQNSWNREVHRDNIAGYKGVTIKKHLIKKKFLARINVNNNNIYIGYYNTKEEAARAYDKAAIKHYGEYACLNFPEEHNNAV